MPVSKHFEDVFNYSFSSIFNTSKTPLATWNPIDYLAIRKPIEATVALLRIIQIVKYVVQED